MKLASRISSIRRIAWKQCRSCSADSLSMWRDSFARNPLAGWIRSPRASSTAVTGCWASQSISRSGWSLRSSSAIAASRCAWPSPIGDEMKSARLRRDLPRTQRRGGGGRGDEVAQEQVDLDRVAGVGEMARPLEDDELAARELREPRAGSARPHGVVASVDDEHRALDPGEKLPHALLVLEPGRQLSGDERLGVGLETPADAVLARLRRVRLGEALREEELEEVLVVLDPVVAVPLPPADVLVVQLVEVLDRLQPRGRWRAAAAPAR